MDISVTQEGSVAVLRWNEGENRINVDSLARLNAILDELESLDGPLAIVLTGSGKFFCNGLDLERFGNKPDEFATTIRELERTIGRLLVFPRLHRGGNQRPRLRRRGTHHLRVRLSSDARGSWLLVHE